MNVRRGTILLLALLLGPPAFAAQGGDDDMTPVFPYPTHVTDLENGLRVVLVPMESDGLVAYWTIVRTGSRDEYEPGRSGFAHFFEHMMFRGTERFPSDVYNETVTRMGADANAYTTDDLTAYHLSITAGDLERVMDLESDRFRNLAYEEAVFRTEAGAVYGEYRKNFANPFRRMSEAVHGQAFERHTYGHTTMGYERDIKRMPEMYDYSRSFFSRYYRPENVVLLIAGDVEVASTFELVRRYYGPWERGYVAPQIPAEPEQREERRVAVPYEGKSLPIVWLAYKFDRFDPADPVYLAAGLLADLAFGETSELYKRLVLDEQVVEFVRADAGQNRDPGLFDIYARVKDPQRVSYVLEQIDRTLAEARERPPDAGRLGDLKSRLKYGFLMGLDTPDAVASRLARIVAITGGVEAIETMYGTIDAIRPEDVVAAAGRYLRPERRTVAILEGAQR